MFASVTSVALVGVEPQPIRVEVHISGRKQNLAIVGLPDTAVREARDRVRSALASSGFHIPKQRVTVNLAPADLPKVGSAYDLPIALGILAASGAVPKAVGDVVALGELALDGSVRAARGNLAAGLIAHRDGRRCVLAANGVSEAALAGGDIHGVATLVDAVSVALGESEGTVIEASAMPDTGPVYDLREVRGQLSARRALEIAAAGSHHLLLWGPPGSGKTMLAKALPGILPSPTRNEELEIAQIWAASGRGPGPRGIRPFRAPHHTATSAALIGGGSGIPVPGEVSLAHRGVLFLDEMGEFPPSLLDALRQPVEDGTVTIARKGVATRFPALVQLVGATNPCPCGMRSDRIQQCRCSETQTDKYRKRLSGPLLDRFDLRVHVARVPRDDLVDSPGESSAAVAARVEAAKAIQIERGGVLNREMSRSDLDQLSFDRDAMVLLERAIDRQGLSARGFDRLRRVARTVADLEHSPNVTKSHMAEALALRGSW